MNVGQNVGSSTEGTIDGFPVVDGAIEGWNDGNKVGPMEGAEVITSVGLMVGETVSVANGNAVGTTVGE